MRYAVFLALLAACGSDAGIGQPDASSFAPSDAPIDSAAEVDAGDDNVIEETMETSLECEPGLLRCSGLQPQVCTGTNRWADNGPPCRAVCDQGVCVD